MKVYSALELPQNLWEVYSRWQQEGELPGFVDISILENPERELSSFCAIAGQLAGVFLIDRRENGLQQAYNDYNWDFLGLSGEDNMNALVDTGDGSTIGERLAGGEYGELQKQHLQAVDHERSKTTGRVQYLPEGQGTTLNAMDPKLQRDMNALFLLDTLALQTDRHSDNFLIQADDQGQYLGLKGIDNDISFGEKEEAFGKKMNNYSGLPSSMLIDQGIADRVRAVSEKELKKTFSDLLTEGEIQALWVRFQKLSKYIDEMEEQNLLVPEWNDETAKKQLMMQTGVGGDAKDYYSRHLLALNMKSTKLRNV